MRVTIGELKTRPGLAFFWGISRYPQGRFGAPLITVISPNQDDAKGSSLPADEGIRTLNFDSAVIVLHQTECPRGHAKGSHPCYLFEGSTPLYCTARMNAAGLRVEGGRWMHTCQGIFDPHPVRLLLPQRARCPKCNAAFVRVPGEIEDPWREPTRPG